MPRHQLPNLGLIPVYSRRQMLAALPSWRQTTDLPIAVLHEPDQPTEDDWLVLSARFRDYWNFPAKPVGSGPTWGFSRLRRPWPHRPYFRDETPLREDQGVWLTYRGTPLAYLVSFPAYHAWARTKLVV
ncbi:MAG: hypothetical protein INF43_05140 [Alphaproteobacteria bacterium]|nr:hypothetical protein [Alphaproteobacteria bacterium]